MDVETLFSLMFETFTLFPLMFETLFLFSCCFFPVLGVVLSVLILFILFFYSCSCCPCPRWSFFLKASFLDCPMILIAPFIYFL